MVKIKEFNIAKLRTEEDFGFQKRIEAKTTLATRETRAEKKRKGA